MSQNSIPILAAGRYVSLPTVGSKWICYSFNITSKEIGTVARTELEVDLLLFQLSVVRTSSTSNH